MSQKKHRVAKAFSLSKQVLQECSTQFSVSLQMLRAEKCGSFHISLSSSASCSLSGAYRQQ